MFHYRSSNSSYYANDCSDLSNINLDSGVEVIDSLVETYGLIGMCLNNIIYTLNPYWATYAGIYHLIYNLDTSIYDQNDRTYHNIFLIAGDGKIRKYIKDSIWSQVKDGLVYKKDSTLVLADNVSEATNIDTRFKLSPLPVIQAPFSLI